MGGGGSKEGGDVGMGSVVAKISGAEPVGENTLHAVSAASVVENPESARNSFLLIRFFMKIV